MSRVVKDIIIRPCDFLDTPNILSLMDQLGYSSSVQELEQRLRIYQQPGYGVYVACLEKKIVGLVAWSQSALFVSSKVRTHIEALVVDQHFRKQGIGKKLMELVEKKAFESGSTLVDLTSGQRRAKDGSHDFYNSLGYVNKGPMSKFYFRKELTL